MGRCTVRVSVVGLAIGLVAAQVAPHGGSYRGPGNAAPPTNNNNSGSSSSTSAPSGPGPTSPGGGSGGSSGPGPSAPSAPVGAGAAGGGRGVGRGVPVGDDLTRWQYWWEWNKDPYLRLKDAVHQGVQRGSDDEFFAPTRSVFSVDTLRPTRADIEERVMPALIRALRGTDQRDLVSSCLVALAKIDRGGGVADWLELVRARLSSRDQEIRETAALALGISGRQEAIGDLIALLTDSEAGRRLCDRVEVDVRTRSFAAFALGLAGRGVPVTRRRALIAPFVHVLEQNHSSRDLPVAAIHGLRLLGSAGGELDRELERPILDALWSYFERERDSGAYLVRAHVLTAVAELVGPGRDRGAVQRQRLAGLLTGGEGSSAEVSQAAALALGVLCRAPEEESESAPFVTALQSAFERAKDAQTRYFALVALGEIGGAGCARYLTGVLEAGNKALERPWAAVALGIAAFRDPALRDGAGRALMRQLVEVRNEETRSAVSVALGLCGDQRAAGALRLQLEDNRHRDELAGYSCIGLALMGARPATDEIRAVVVDSVRRPGLLRQAAVALGKIGDKSAGELLVGLLGQGDHNLAKLAAVSIALGQIGDRRSIEPLLELLEDEAQPALSRAFAAVALGSVADRAALPWNSGVAFGVNYRAAVGVLTNGISGVLDIL